MRIVVTGGAGYIGSHACARLLDEGHEVLIIDDLRRGHAPAIAILEELGGDRLHFAQLDIGDGQAVGELLAATHADAVIHFAAYAYVGESVANPGSYWRNNAGAAFELIAATRRAGIGRFVFSSSCAVYGSPERAPVREGDPLRPESPYGWTKLSVELALEHEVEAARRAGKPFEVTALRYFNVAGCAIDGRLGCDQRPETRILPIAIESALGRRGPVEIMGTDYATRDGTAIRDYIHVDDLVDAHVRALGAMTGESAFRAYNVGRGDGVTVRELLSAVERITGRAVPTVESPRREGDAEALWAAPSLINRELGWSAQVRDLDEIVASAARWMESHPDGYGGRRAALAQNGN